MGIVTWMAAAPEVRTQKKEEAAMLASPGTRQPPQLRFMKKTEKAKAVALKLTPSRSFCKVAPELSLGCASASPLHDRRAGGQENKPQTTQDSCPEVQTEKKKKPS